LNNCKSHKVAERAQRKETRLKLDTVMLIRLSKCRGTLEIPPNGICKFVVVRNLYFLLLFTVLSSAVFAQDEDYYEAEKPRAPIMSEPDLDNLYRWGPKFGIEAFGSVGYSHFYTPSTISGAFDKATGGFGYDAGIGGRIRIYHKLAMAFGFQFSGRGCTTAFPAFAETDAEIPTPIRWMGTKPFLYDATRWRIFETGLWLDEPKR